MVWIWSKRELAIRKIMIHNIRMEKHEDQTVTVTLQVSRDNDANCAELQKCYLRKTPR